MIISDFKELRDLKTIAVGFGMMMASGIIPVTFGDVCQTQSSHS